MVVIGGLQNERENTMVSLSYDGYRTRGLQDDVDSDSGYSKKPRKSQVKDLVMNPFATMLPV